MEELGPVVDAELAWLICFGLKPRATHSGTPCTHMSTLGAKDQPQETQEHVTITLEIMEHQESRGFLASNENPETSLLFKREDWKLSLIHI